jgi:hypothetical protein
MKLGEGKPRASISDSAKSVKTECFSLEGRRGAIEEIRRGGVQGTFEGLFGAVEGIFDRGKKRPPFKLWTPDHIPA